MNDFVHMNVNGIGLKRAVEAQLHTMVIAGILHLKQVAIDGHIIFGVIVQPLIVACTAIYLLREKDSFDMIYAIVGSGLSSLWSNTMYFSVYAARVERWTGTLESLIGSPMPLISVLLGKSLANALLAFLSTILAYLLVISFFEYELTIHSPWLFAVTWLLAILGIVSFGLLLMPLALANLGATNWANTFEFPMYILGGFLFPISILPPWTTFVSYLLSPYWAAQALHTVSQPTLDMGILLLYWGFLVFWSGVNIGLSLWLFQITLHRARKTAVLAYK